MNEEVLWEIVENHFYACEGGYARSSVYRIPWDRQAWLLEFSIGSSRYRAVIVKHNRAHIYILKCVAEPDAEFKQPSLSVPGNPVSTVQPLFFPPASLCH